MTDKAKKQPTGDYEVGYARTPKETRWRKGECPNPHGRPRKALAKPGASIAELLRAELEKPVSVREGNKDVTLTLREVIVRKLAHDLAQAPLNSRLRLLKEVTALGVFDAPAGDDRVDADVAEKLVQQLAEEYRRTQEVEEQFPNRP